MHWTHCARNMLPPILEKLFISMNRDDINIVLIYINWFQFILIDIEIYYTTVHWVITFNVSHQSWFVRVSHLAPRTWWPALSLHRVIHSSIHFELISLLGFVGHRLPLKQYFKHDMLSSRHSIIWSMNSITKNENDQSLWIENECV